MADKKKAGVSVVPQFVSGEQPTADKFNSIGVQLERASSELEKSIGDVWGESWPYATTTNTKLTLPYGRNHIDHGAVSNANDSFLDIANIARIIGSAANLNPVLTEYSNAFSLNPTYSVNSEVLQSAGAQEKKEFWIRFPPKKTGAADITFTGTGAPTNRVASHEEVSAAGDWHLSTDRKLTLFTPANNVDDFTITYETVPVSWGTGPDVPGSTYNVIPDPNQTANLGSQCTATLSGDGYIITLPVAEYGRVNNNGTNTQLNGDGDIALGSQLTLPKVITDNFSPGDILPEGFVYLRDNVTGKLYNDGVYEYNNPKVIIVKNVELDTSHGFTVITIGSTITEAIHDLRRKWFHHSHDGTYGEAPIHVSSLAGILESENDSGIYVTSQIANNWMPQYLHRDGYRVDSDANDNNAMRGNIVFGRAVGTPGNYVSNIGASYGVYFGTTSGPKINKSVTNNLIIDNPLSGINITSKDDTYIGSESRFLVLSEDEWDIGTNISSGYCYLRTNYGVLEQTGHGANFKWDAQTGSSSGVNNGSATRAQFRVGDNGNGIGDGEIAFGAKSFTFRSGSYPSASALATKVAETGRVFDISATSFTNGVNPSIAPFIFSSLIYSTNNDILELFHLGVPTDDSYYIKFTGDSSSSPTVYGSIRGTNSSTAPVFYSSHSGNQIEAVYAIGTSVGPPVPSQDAGHIKFVSGGADYGEWIRCGDLSEWEAYKNPEINNKLGLPEGLIVYVKEGKFYRAPIGIPMVVTNRAIVIGNLKEGLWPDNECEVLSFIGQVPVMCFGPVKDGDYLISSIEEPGTAIAISPDSCSFEDYKKVIGTAWETNESTSLKLVNCAIGKK